MSGESVHPEIGTLVRDVLIGSSVARALGIELRELAVDRAVLALPFADRNITVASIVHGGVIATLIDIAAAAASFSGFDGNSKAGPKGGANGTLTVTYLAPADGADLLAEAIVIRRGRRQTTEDVSVRDGNGVLVAKGLVTSHLF